MVHQIGQWADPIYTGDYPVEMKNQIARLSFDEGWETSRLPEFTQEEKIMLNGTCDFYSLQMYSSRIVTGKNKERKRYSYEEASAMGLPELAFWFRPGWYGDIEVWTALDQEKV